MVVRKGGIIGKRKGGGRTGEVLGAQFEDLFGLDECCYAGAMNWVCQCQKIGT